MASANVRPNCSSGARPLHLLEPLACRPAQVNGLGTFSVERRTIHHRPLYVRSASASVCPGPAASFKLAAWLKLPDLRQWRSPLPGVEDWLLIVAEQGAETQPRHGLADRPAFAHQQRQRGL